jgi:hypothetical protein
VELLNLKAYSEVVDEIYYKVSHLEPWERGTRKTAGMSKFFLHSCLPIRDPGSSVKALILPVSMLPVACYLVNNLVDAL